MVGRGLEVVMAFFLLLCPHARSPRSRATASRCRISGAFGPLEPAHSDRLDGESQARSSPSIALGGYRVWGCQVTEKGLQIKANAQQRLRCYRLREPPAALDFEA